MISGTTDGNCQWSLVKSPSQHRAKSGEYEAQRAWIKFRDANCSFYYDPEGGSAAHLAGNGCVLKLIVQQN